MWATEDSSGSRRHSLGFGLFLVLPFLAGCSYTVPNVCEPCEIEHSAQDRGYNVSQANTTAVIDVRADGSARWTIRTNLDGPDADALRTNASVVEEVTNERIRNWGLVPSENIHNVSTAFENETLVVQYEVRDMADRYPGDGLVLDTFHRQSDGTQFGYEVDVDRIVLRPPDGWVLANRPPNGRVEDGAVAWTESVGRRTYVAFAPDRSRASRIAVNGATGWEVTTWLARPVLVGTFASASVMVTVGLLLVEQSRGDLPFPPSNRALANAGIIAPGAAFILISPSTVAAGVGSFGVLVVPVLVFAVLAIVADSEAGYHWPVLVAMVGTSGLVSITVVVTTGDSPFWVTTIWGFLATTGGTLVYLLIRHVQH